MSKERKTFEKEAKEFLSRLWNKDLEERTIQIKDVSKKFDLVSEDNKFIGDLKYYKNIKVPAAKWSAIAEYVWLLEKTDANKKFLVFGNDIEVPARWLKRFDSLTDVEFYFFADGKLIKLK